MSIVKRLGLAKKTKPNKLTAAKVIFNSTRSKYSRIIDKSFQNMIMTLKTLKYFVNYVTKNKYLFLLYAKDSELIDTRQRELLRNKKNFKHRQSNKKE